MKVLPIELFLPFRTDQVDDLLIIANSFEKRCTAFVQKITSQTPSYEAKSVVLITYSDRQDPLVRQKCGLNLRNIEHFAKRISLSRSGVYHLGLEPYEIWPAQKAFNSLFASITNKSSVVIDISTIPKLHLIYLLDEAIKSRRIGKLRLVYTRARYGKYDALSWGAEEPIIVPTFGKPSLKENEKSCLLLFCGLEPERSYSIWRRFGQDRCVRIFIDSGEDDFDRPTSRALRYHNFDEREPPLVCQAFRPEEVKKTINDVYSECKCKNEHLFISPLTTKWEACAVWEYFHEQGNDINASIVYCSPGRFNASGYTVDEFGDLLYSDIGLDYVPLKRQLTLLH